MLQNKPLNWFSRSLETRKQSNLQASLLFSPLKAVFSSKAPITFEKHLIENNYFDKSSLSLGIHTIEIPLLTMDN